MRPANLNITRKKQFHLLIAAFLAFWLGGCAVFRASDDGIFYRRSQEKKLTTAVQQLENGNLRDATALLTEICDAKGVPGVTDEALFRLSILALRPGVEKDNNQRTLERLERLLREYPSSSWTRLAWPLMEHLDTDEELRRQNVSLKGVNQTLSREIKDLQNLKNLNQSLIRDNKELRQSIERLKSLDLELEMKNRR